MNKYLTTLAIIGCLLGSTLVFTPLAAANSTASEASTNSEVAGVIIQSYNADPSVAVGMIVGFKDKSHSLVIPLTAQASRNMLGVVVPASNATLALTPQSDNNQQVLVATAGTYLVLVSNQNGPIKAGDYLTMSSLSGIAMKANSEQQEVIGRAASSFNGTADVIDQAPIKTGSGQLTTVSISRVTVDLRLAPNPLYSPNNSLPGALSKTAVAIVKKPVSAEQVYLSLILVILTFFVTGTIYYSAVRSSIVSIGRNPLSKRSIIAGLIKVLVVGLVVFGAGVLSSYLVLKS